MESDLKGDDDLLYKEWTSRRPWKERKNAIKEREKGSLQLISHKDDPQMIYYGWQSGVVGLSMDFFVVKIKFAAFVDARCVKQSNSDAMSAVTNGVDQTLRVD
ncbi:hypothetical protein Tco_0658073, partial [Tanacetum coccineum]